MDELLGSDRAFVPVRTRDGRDRIVNRDAILSLEVDADAPTSLQRAVAAGGTGGTVEFVRIELSDGSVVEGALRMLGPAPNRRVSDLFNGPERFLPVETGGRIVFVNKRRVVWVGF